MKLVIPGIDGKEDSAKEILNLMIEAYWKIHDKTGMGGYITDDEGNVIRGFI